MRISAKGLLALGALLLYLLLVIFTGSSCTTQKKVEKYLKKYPLYNAANCNERFPVKSDSVVSYITDSALIQAFEEELAIMYRLLDSYVSQDSVRIEFKDRLQTVVKPIYKTKTVTITKESTAKISLIQASKDSAVRVMGNKVALLDKEIEDCFYAFNELKEKDRKHRWQRTTWFIAFLLAMGWNFRKPILKLLV